MFRLVKTRLAYALFIVLGLLALALGKFVAIGAFRRRQAPIALAQFVGPALSLPPA